MLSSFTIENFKSYREATLKLAPLTVLIGANASGKSNAIEGLRLLSWIAEGNRLGSFRYASQDKNRAIRGKVSELGFQGRHAFSLSCDTTELDWNHYSITLAVRDDNELHIADERLTGSGYASLAPLFKVATPSSGTLGDMFVAYNNFARGGRKPQLMCNDQMAVLVQLMTSARFESGHKKAQQEIPAVTRGFHRLLSDITLLDPRPSLMRNYSPMSEQKLDESGENLSGVLYNLCQDKDVKNELLKFIGVFRRICGQNGGLVVPRQTHSVRVCSPPSRRVAPPPLRGATAWTPAPRTRVPALVVLLKEVWVG